MKNFRKLIIVLLAFVALFGFVGCTKDHDKKGALEVAANSLFLGDLSTLTDNVDLPTVTPTHKLPITWAVKNGSETVKIVVNNDGTVTAVVNRLPYQENEKGEEEVRFGEAIITATITNKLGSVTKEFELYVRSKENVVEGLSIAQLKADVLVYDGREIDVTGKNEQFVSVTGVISHVGADGFMITDGKDSLYVFQYDAQKEGYKVGDEVSVYGRRCSYYKAPQIDKDDLKVTVLSSGNPVDYSKLDSKLTLTQVLALGNEVKDYANWTQIVKISGALTMGEDSDGDPTAELLDYTTGKSIPIETSYTLHDNGLAELKALDGKYIESWFYVYDYHSTYNSWRLTYITGQAKEVAAPEVTDADKAGFVKDALVKDFDGKTFKEDIELPTSDVAYEGLTITWSSNNTDVVANDGKVTPSKTADTEVTLTATIKLNAAEVTVEVKVTIPCALPVFTTVTGLADIPVGTDVIFVAEVKSIAEGGDWSTQYNNMSVFVTDGTSDVQLFRTDTKVAVGYKIVVKGTVGEYSGTKQINAKSVSAKFDDSGLTSLADANSAAKDTEIKVFGMVKEINTAYNSEFDNITVTIVDAAGTTFYCYRVKGNLEVGQLVYLTGKVGQYNNKNQLAQGGVATVVEPKAGDGSVEEEVTYTEMTVDALLNAIAAAPGTTINAKLTVKYLGNTSTYNSPIFADATGYIYSYAGADKYGEIAVGDVVTLEVDCTNNYQTRQIKAVKSCEKVNVEVTPLAEVALTAEMLALDVTTDGSTDNAKVWAASFYGKFVSAQGTVLAGGKIALADGKEIVINSKDAKAEMLAENIGAVVTIKGLINNYYPTWTIYTLGLENSVTIDTPAPVVEAKAITKVTSVETLVAGTKIIFAYENNVMGAQGSDIRLRVECDLSNNTIEPNKVQVVTLVAGATEGAFLLQVGENEYLCRNAKNKVSTGATGDEFKFVADGDLFKVINVTDTDKEWILQYNANSGQERFACYAGTQKNLTIYTVAE